MLLKGLLILTAILSLFISECEPQGDCGCLDEEPCALPSPIVDFFVYDLVAVLVNVTGITTSCDQTVKDSIDCDGHVQPTIDILRNTIDGEELCFDFINFTYDDIRQFEEGLDVQCTFDEILEACPNAQIFPHCISPRANDNARIVSIDGTSYKSNVTFECDEGYTMAGDATITCTITGTWSNIFPICTIVDCGSPATVDNSGITKNDGTTYNSNITYACDEGYTLNGTDSITCQSNGHWDSTGPTCKIVNCGSPDTVENSQIINFGITYNSNITFACNDGYTMNGSDTITCQSNGNWSNSVPACDIVDCGSPDSVENGQMSRNDGTTYNSNITYTCKSGYILSGTDTITCLSNGNWSSVLTCDIVDCGSPPTIENSQTTNNDGTTYNSNITFACNDGYNLSGNETIICESNGNWSSWPSCNIVDCGNPDTVMNSQMSNNDGTTYSSNITYTCKEGYNLSGNDTITCQSSGKWNSNVPSCVIVDCGAPATVDNSEMSNNSGTTYSSNITFECNEGYTLSGNDTITCLSNGKWSNSVPTCNIVDCGSPSTVENSQISNNDGTTYNSNVTYTCNEGYTLSGTDTITCQSNGNWSSVLTCNIVDCGSPPIVDNSQISNNEGTVYNSNITYTCNDGYSLNGNDTKTCLSNGNWTSNSFTCNEILEVVVLLFLPTTLDCDDFTGESFTQLQAEFSQSLTPMGMDTLSALIEEGNLETASFNVVGLRCNSPLLIVVEAVVNTTEPNSNITTSLVTEAVDALIDTSVNISIDGQNLDAVITDNNPLEITVEVCPVGYFTKVESLETCEKCPKDTYQPEDIRELCVTCPNGTHTTAPGTVGIGSEVCLPDESMTWLWIVLGVTLPLVILSIMTAVCCFIVRRSSKIHHEVNNGPPNPPTRHFSTQPVFPRLKSYSPYRW